ncbi:hypothetical protein R0131_11370 [Clostridium sp. AL.422]|uniref:hypothetical protein n=1 Tax=Clostridium TaxID=1485 RepID=UPI00293DDC52|nr:MULTISPECIES: hypothetical protein [unclassified Clostridium]MDV4151441.1 hypothetical protein [Clostridium sp. AL.422]
MFEIKNYKIGFDILGLLLFLIIMIPNFIWFAVPTSNDILRNESLTPVIDIIASIFQVITIMSLCIIKNKQCQKLIKKPWLKWIIICIIIYFIGWILYYIGIVNSVIILDLCIAPCVAFILLSIERKNIVALIASTIFMICHVLYGIMNFIV